MLFLLLLFSSFKSSPLTMRPRNVFRICLFIWFVCLFFFLSRFSASKCRKHLDLYLQIKYLCTGDFVHMCIAYMSSLSILSLFVHRFVRSFIWPLQFIRIGWFIYFFSPFMYTCYSRCVTLTAYILCTNSHFTVFYFMRIRDLQIQMAHLFADHR